MERIEKGQVWAATRPGSRAKPRTIVWAGCKPPNPALRWIDYPTVGWVHDPEAPAYPEMGHDSWLSQAAFRAWARQHGARPMTPTSDAAGEGRPEPHA